MIFAIAPVEPLMYAQISSNFVPVCGNPGQSVGVAVLQPELFGEGIHARDRSCAEFAGSLHKMFAAHHKKARSRLI